MRALHLAAMPFPTTQGTQALVASMLRTLAEQEGDAHLLTYARSDERAEARAHPGLHVHRLADFPADPSVRSGPSLPKLALDLQLALRVRSFLAGLGCELLVAHHVEAAFAASLSRVRPWVYVAHTRMDAELGSYLARLPPHVAGRLGGALDGHLSRAADAVGAVSPRLGRCLTRDHGIAVVYLPAPWVLPDPISEEERRAARSLHHIDADADVVLFAGNLDPYQGWEDVIAAIAELGPRSPRLRLLLATASDARPALECAQRAGIADRLILAPLGDEARRRSIHAAADLALVPRRVEGGVSIKLVDALSRGLPTVVTERAASGLSIEGAAFSIRDDDPSAMAAAISLALHTRDATRELGERGRHYVSRAHSPRAFLEAYEALLTRARGRGARRPPGA